MREERVNTVEDFLVSFFLDPTRLRNVRFCVIYCDVCYIPFSVTLGSIAYFKFDFSFSKSKILQILGVGMSAKMWEVAVEHARTCVLDQKLQFYGTSQENGVVFNIVGQLMGTISNSHYLHTDNLSESEKAYSF